MYHPRGRASRQEHEAREARHAERRAKRLAAEGKQPMAESMTPERLAEIRQIAIFGWMRTNIERTEMRAALVDALAYVDELSIEYTGDPPPEPDPSLPCRGCEREVSPTEAYIYAGLRYCPKCYGERRAAEGNPL